MKLPKISVIMPVFNTGEKLVRSIESVLKQSFRDFELILIDDGSTDGSEMICDDYQKKDNRIYVIHQKNMGLCNARNIGLKYAKGEYVAFIDHDDIYLNKLMEDNYKLAKEYDADIVKFGYKFISMDNQLKFKWKRNVELTRMQYYSGNLLYEKYGVLRENGILIYIWDALFKKAYLDKFRLGFNSRFTVGQEDIDFCVRSYQFIKKFVYNPNIYYVHYRYLKSTSRGIKKENILKLIQDQIFIFEEENKIIRKNLNNSLLKSYFERMKINHLLFILSSLMRKNISISLQEKKSIILEFRNNEIFLNSKFIECFKECDLKEKICYALFFYKKITLLIFLCQIYIKWMELKNNINFRE